MRRRFMPIGISPNNVIRYTTSDGSIVSLYRDDFGATMVEYSYDVLRFNSNVLYIGNYVFRDCKNLTSIEIPNSVTSIGDWAFGGCSSLTNIELPNSVTSIGGNAFGGCSSLTNIQIPNSVTSIGDYAFYGCESLKSIQISNSVTSIGNYAFEHCSSLISVYIESTTPPTLSSYVFDNNAPNRKIYVPRASLNAYRTASGWSSYADAIEPYDFDGNSEWAYELHLTPEWEGPFFEQTVHIEGDFSKVFNLLYTMTKALGADDTLSDIPTLCNITVDGQRLSYIYIYATDTIELTFEEKNSSNISGILTQTYISLDKWLV